jgi:aromatic ring-opening dioxygenase catalytic subunit (LigB family)
MLTPAAYLVPNRPTLVLDQHRGHRTPMLEALARAASDLTAAAPDMIVALSARWTTPGPFRVDEGVRHRTITDYSGLGVEVRYDCDGQPALARALVEAGRRAGLRVAAATHGVDSGITVPLHFLLPTRRVPVVPLSLPAQDAATCQAWGEALHGALEAWPARVAFIVGGVLSCNEHAWNLKRDVAEAREFDEATLAALERGAWDELQNTRRAIRDHARPEAGLRHLEVLRGFVGGATCAALRCYESGPGMGAALIEFTLAARSAAAVSAPAVPATPAEPTPDA